MPHIESSENTAARHTHEKDSLRALREPKERVTTYVQDNIIMRISSNSHNSQSSSSNPYLGSGTHAHHSNLDFDPNGGIGHLSSSASSSNEQRGGADHRRKWYRERMARIIQDIEPGLPPSGGRGRGRGYNSGAGSSGSAGGAGGGYVYSGMMGMGSGGAGAGAGGYGGTGSGSGGYAGAGAGADYGTTNGTNGTNVRDSGYGSFSGSGGGSYGRGH
ncbi:hypothetical protein B0H65DRAFT_591082 [Neurospora tetraspora]|uniref:Uncharacterized protein n=1 Tax=Neurospora tetraspora TaxID=94610 RepID=A0AAE0MPY3_9PEZI|nr:hypothetical protein B0H65DRAFT_591082 [Neurospora tetraspora]